MSSPGRGVRQSISDIDPSGIGDRANLATIP